MLQHNIFQCHISKLTQFFSHPSPSPPFGMAMPRTPMLQRYRMEGVVFPAVLLWHITFPDVLNEVECPRVAVGYDVCVCMRSLYHVACLRKK